MTREREQRKTLLKLPVDRIHLKTDETLSQKLDNLLTQLDPNELVDIEEIGAGGGGTVTAVFHGPTQRIMARKRIVLYENQEVHKQITRELQALHLCASPHIVKFYGSFVQESQVNICMEFMDLRSMDYVLKQIGPFNETTISIIAVIMLETLHYLKDKHNIIHRDVKPSNILLNSSGEVKLCDFGVSGTLTQSLAKSFKGTHIYMSPERIKAEAYSVQSDIWSLGMTLMEIALGKHPFFLGKERLSPFDCLEKIVHEPSPRLPEGKFSKDFQNFLHTCLMKDASEREDLPTLLKHPFVSRQLLRTVHIMPSLVY